MNPLDWLRVAWCVLRGVRRETESARRAYRDERRTATTTDGRAELERQRRVTDREGE